MGWRVTVKAGRVRDMKNKRKTGKKRGWSGGGPDNEPKVVPGSDPSPGPDTVQSTAAVAAMTANPKTNPAISAQSATVSPATPAPAAPGTSSAPAPAVAQPSADDDGKEDHNNIPASGEIPTINIPPSDSDQPIEMATAAASSPVSPVADNSIATATAPIIAPNTAPVAPITVVAAPNTTLTIAPTGTVPEPLHTSFTQIQQITHDPTTNSTTYIFNDGTSITTEPLNKQEYKCTISPSPNLIAQP